jgi:hypothetical protein
MPLAARSASRRSTGSPSFQRLADLGAAVVGIEHGSDQGERAAAVLVQLTARSEQPLHAPWVPVAERQPAQRVDEHDDIFAASASAWRDQRQLGGMDLVARLLIGGRREDLGLREGALPLRDLLRTLVRKQHADVRAGLSDRRAEGAQQRGPARARLCEDETRCPKARAEQVDPAHQRICCGVGRQQPAVRWGRGEVLEVRALLLRALPVDGLDADESAVALAAPRLPGRAGDAIAGAELAAPDLRRRDVDVPLRLAHAAQPQEAVALRYAVEHAGDLLGLDLGLRRLRLLLPPRVPHAPEARVELPARGLDLGPASPPPSRSIASISSSG